MKNYRWLIYLLLIVAILVVVKIVFFPAPAEMKGPPGKPGGKGPAAAKVNGYIVQTEKLDNTVYISGTLLPNESVILKPEISGRITGLYIKEGKLVNKGALLVKINDADLIANHKKLKAQIKLAEEKEERMRKLIQTQAVSKEEYDIALNELNSLKAELEVVQVQISRTEIRAPFSGKIGLKQVSEGSYISPQDVIATIQQTDPIKIDFSVPEKYALQAKEGNTIIFSVEGSEKKYTGKIYATESSVDQMNRTLQIRAIADNKDQQLFPGSFAEVTMVLNNIPDALMIPTPAVVPVLKGQQVWVSRNGKAEAVKIQTGFRNAERVQVLEGLKAGDTIVTTGIMGLKPGTSLKFLNVEKK